MNPNPINLSIAAPAYNEQAGIRTVLMEWYDFLKNNPMIQQFEIIVCNDGSQDGTADILDEMAKIYPEMRPLHFLVNQGAAAALTAAIAKTSYEWVLLMDSDGQFPIKNVSQMMAIQQASQATGILGVRKKKDHAWGRWGTKLSGMVCNRVHGSRLQDFNTAFKLVKGSVLRSLTLEAKGMNYSTEITSRLLECEAPLVEIDIDHQPRVAGQSHMKLVSGSLHRLLFVSYIAWRQLLLKLGIIRRHSL